MKKTLLILFVAVQFGLTAQNSLRFDGNGDYVTTTYAGVLGDTARTIEAWVKSHSGNGEQVIVAYGNEGTSGARFTFRLKDVGGTSDVIRIENKGGGLDGTINVGDSTWHHVAVTYDPAATNKYKLYVDGILDNEGNISTPLNTMAVTPVRIGRRLSATYTGYFDGSIDEVRIWNVARTVTEIQASMNAEFCGAPTGLTAYYKLNEGVAGGTNTTITTTQDYVSGNDGTLIGFSLTGNNSNWVTGSGIASGAGSGVATPLSLTVCDEYVAANGTIFNTNGTYFDTLSTAAGCDSLLELNLTVNNSSASALTVTGCNSYTSPSGNHTWTTSGTVYDTLPNNTGCDSVLTIALTINTVDTAILVNGAYLTAYASGANYQWLDCINGYAPIAGATNQVFQAVANGNYAVRVDDNGCVDTSACHAVENIRVHENTFSKSVSIYPNPATHVLRVQLKNVQHEVHIALINTAGKMVAETSQNGGQEISLPIDLPAGIYFVHITANHENVIKKIAIH